MLRPIAILVALAVAGALRAPPRLRTAARAPRPRAGTARAAAATEPGFELSLFSPAKINLFLRVIKKRDDGFHELASLFQAVDLGDVLHFDKLGAGDADALECDTPGMRGAASRRCAGSRPVTRIRGGAAVT